jgi:hypothetical protein
MAICMVIFLLEIPYIYRIGTRMYVWFWPILMMCPHTLLHPLTPISFSKPATPSYQGSQVQTHCRLILLFPPSPHLSISRAGCIAGLFTAYVVYKLRNRDHVGFTDQVCLTKERRSSSQASGSRSNLLCTAKLFHCICGTSGNNPLCSARYTLHLALNTLHSTLYDLDSTLYATLSALHSTRYTLCNCSVHYSLYILNSTP